jgi:hypothetical protein
VFSLKSTMRAPMSKARSGGSPAPWLTVMPSAARRLRLKEVADPVDFGYEEAACM